MEFKASQSGTELGAMNRIAEVRIYEDVGLSSTGVVLRVKQIFGKDYSTNKPNIILDQRVGSG